MGHLTKHHFPEFFKAVYGYEPFPWQVALVETILDSAWPELLQLPTASGKTACLDAAVFTLACQASQSQRMAPRRIWMVVDRRIVVDEAYHRAKKLADELRKSSSGVTGAVADALKALSGTSIPLVAARLRGGALRDNEWARLPWQPSIITSTVDQAGSRLLFRAYGSGDLSASVYAGLLGNDSLIILDEAHCAVPFLQTLRAVRRYRGAGWAESPIESPFVPVIMSATPPGGIAFESVFPKREEREGLLDHPILKRRLLVSKPAELRTVTKQPSRKEEGVPGDPFINQAEISVAELVAGGKRQLAVMVNRVRTALQIYKQLKRAGHFENIYLLVGPERPFERDETLLRLTKVFKAEEHPIELDEPHILVTTQCLEVGADFSFDGLVCECASLDALRQRFGRLDRFGVFPERRAIILIREEQKQPKTPDAVYGEALSKTWHCLESLSVIRDGSPIVDFGIETFERRLQEIVVAQRLSIQPLSAPYLSAPILLPAHLDNLCQTAPRPDPEAAVSVFLHGAELRAPEIRIVWRCDLNQANDPSLWLETINLFPPLRGECLTTTIPKVRRWLANHEKQSRSQTLPALSDDQSDIEGQHFAEKMEPESNSTRPFLIWRGHKRSNVLHSLDLIEPGELIVVPSDYGCPDYLGFVETFGETGAVHDIAEPCRIAAGTVIVRIRRDVLEPWMLDPQVAALTGIADQPDVEVDDIRNQLESLLGEISANASFTGPDWLKQGAKELGNDFSIERHPRGGLVLVGKYRFTLEEEEPLADEDDLPSRAEREMTLLEHTEQVATAFASLGAKCLPGYLVPVFDLAIRYHDVGKSDSRFQYLLRNGDEGAFLPSSEILAKSSRLPRAPRRLQAIKEASKLPKGFRHEMLSFQIANESEKGLDPSRRDLFLHLIASHHGYARPFAPVVPDPDPTSIKVQSAGFRIAIDPAARKQAVASYRLDSGISDRFWALTRRFGWWGLAYLEAIFRTADWYASSHNKRLNATPKTGSIEVTISCKRDPSSKQETVLSGLDGSNPLAYLAALGAFKLCGESQRFHTNPLRMRWTRIGGAWHPVFEASDRLERAEIIATIAQQLQLGRVDPKIHPHLKLGKNLSVEVERFRKFVEMAVDISDGKNRRCLDFIASFGCEAEAFKHESLDRVAATEFHFNFGSGHQHYLETIEKLLTVVDADRIEAALFEPWQYNDPRLSMRWDPEDAREHAYQWTAPSQETPLTVWAANLLAFEGSTFFPTMPQQTHLRTTGFKGAGGRASFNWPIWGCSISLDSCRSLVALCEVSGQAVKPDELRQRGIEAIFSSRKLKIGEGQNFKWAFSPSIAL